MAIEAETRRLGELRSLTPLGPVWGIFGLVYRLAKWQANPLPTTLPRATVAR